MAGASEEAGQEEGLVRLRAEAEREPVAALLGLRLVELAPGFARVALTVRPEHLNFNGAVFGGIIVTVADNAFGYASNSLARPSLAAQLNIHFLAGAAPGDELIAECRMLHSGKRAGVSEIAVTNQDGRLIARATGLTIPVPPRA
jgi:acyl-CoA thioesterase